MPAIAIRLLRLSNDRHRLVVERPIGARIERALETRSTLLHDLVHFALEAEAGLTDGFWGTVAAGVDYDALLAEDAMAVHPGIARAEALVGPMQAVWHGRLSAERYVELAHAAAPFVDLAFVARVRERLRRLWGQWQATPFHAAMALHWPPAATPAAATPPDMD